MTIAVLQMEQRSEYAIVQQSRPLLDAVRKMDESLADDGLRRARLRDHRADAHSSSSTTTPCAQFGTQPRR